MESNQGRTQVVMVDNVVAQNLEYVAELESDSE
jgi:hypothetical protein